MLAIWVFLILALTATVAAVGAAAATTAIVGKRFKLKYEALANQEIAEAQEFYTAIHAKPSLEEVAAELNPGDAVRLVDTAIEAVNKYQGKIPYNSPEVLGKITSVTETADGLVVEGEKDPKVTNNIFVDGRPMEDDFDYDAEIPLRSEDAPYIISRDEFNQGEKDYAQDTLTFYVLDDTLCDARDLVIPDSDGAVGDVNLQKFGHGSGDNNVVYVRNDRMETDFEVLKSKNSYAKDVLGLRHADGGGSRKTRRFRGEDE